MAGWVMDRRLQCCDNDELAELLTQLLALEHETNVCSSRYRINVLMARQYAVLDAMAERGVQMRFFD